MADSSNSHRRPWAVVQHVAFEGPGSLAPLATERGIAFETVALYAGDALPGVEEIGGLIVMGGPMGVYEAEEYPFLAAEMALMRAAVKQDRPVLGICLGAQLLAQALGGKVYKGTVLEIGPGTVRLTPAGRTDEIFSAAAESLPVMHWHQDTFTLPPNAIHLASSELYPHQAFRVGRLAYGLQFHIEVDEPLAAEWAPHLPATVSLDGPACRTIASAGRKVLARFFDAAMAMQAEGMQSSGLRG